MKKYFIRAMYVEYHGECHDYVDYTFIYDSKQEWKEMITYLSRNDNFMVMQTGVKKVSKRK